MIRFCPFCGGEADVKLHPAADERAGYRQCATVTCVGCGARMTSCSEQDANGWIKPEETGPIIINRVVSKWNRRAEE